MLKLPKAPPAARSHRRRKTCPFSGRSGAEDRLQGQPSPRTLHFPSAARSCPAASPPFLQRSSVSSPAPSSARASWVSSLRSEVNASNGHSHEVGRGRRPRLPLLSLTAFERDS